MKQLVFLFLAFFSFCDICIAGVIDKYIPFQVATILTKYNADVEGLECMYEMLCGFNKIKRWDIRVGFMSFYHYCPVKVDK